MLRTKLSLEHKLANGSTGVVREIIYYNDCRPPMLPDYVLVEFDDYHGPTVPGTNLVPVKQIRCDSENKDISHMLNIPLALSFAQTIYKSQGKTLDRAVVDIGKSEQALGQAYVALSRTRRMTDMRLKPFARERLTSIAKHQEMPARRAEVQKFIDNNIIH